MDIGTVRVARLLIAFLWLLSLNALGQEAPVLTLREGHQSEVIAVKALRSDEIATISTDGSMKIWNSEDGGVLLTLFPSGVGEVAAKRRQITQAAFSPSGEFVAVCMPPEAPAVKIFNLHTEAVVATITLPEQVQCLAMADDAVFIQVESTLSRYDLSGKLTAGWDIPRMPEPPPVKNPLGFEVGGSPETVAGGSSGEVALSQRNGSSVIFLDGKTLKPIRTVPTPPVHRLAFSPDGTRLVTHRKGVLVLETSSGRETGERIDWPVPDEIPGPGYSPFWVESSKIALINRYSVDIYPNLLVWEFGKKPVGTNIEQGAVSAALDGRGRLMVGTYDGEILVEMEPWKYKTLPAKSGQATAITVAPDGSLVVGTSWGEIVFWDRKTGQPIRRFQEDGKLQSLGVSGDGRFLGAIFKVEQGKKSVFWDLESGLVTSFVQGDGVQAESETLLLGGGKAYLVNLEEKADLLVDVRSGEILARREVANPPQSTLYVADRDWIVQIGSLNIFTVLNVSKNLEKVVQLELPRRVYSHLSLDPQGQSVFISGIPTSFFRWDCERPEQLPETLFQEPLPHQNLTRIMAEEDRVLLGTSDGVVYSFSKRGEKLGELNFGAQLTHDYLGLGSNRIAFISRGRVLFGDSREGRLLGYLGLLPENEGWAAISREGIFDGNEEGLSKVDIRLGSKHYSVGQLFLEYFRAGVLASMLGEGTGVPETGKTLTEKDLSQPPGVQILSPASGVEVKSKSVEVRVKVTDRGDGVSGVGLFHNGHKLPAKGTRTGEEYVFTVQVVSGMNEIKATAFDGKGEIESRQERIRFRATEVAEEEPKLHLLAVGIEAYQGIAPLKYSKDDAEAFSQRIQSKQFEPGKRIILTDANASREALFAAFDEIANEAKPEDAFIFYFAGHGVGGDKSFYFLPQDADVTSDSALQSSSISSRDLAERLTQVPATRQLVILDACHSGAFAAALRGEAGSPAGLQHVWSAHYLSRMAGTFMLAASASDESAAEVEELGHGVLTYVLLQSLEEAEGDEEMTVNLLLSLVTRGVRRLAKKFEGVDQNVVQFSSGQDFSLF